MSANIRFEDWLEKRMTDPEFRAAWEESGPGYQVALLRLRRGLTQKALADLVGTKQSSIARLESGKTEPRLSFLRRVVVALGGQLTIHIAASEDLVRQEETAPSVQAAASRTGISWISSKPGLPLAGMSALTTRQGSAVYEENCPPGRTRRPSYVCSTEANAQTQTGLLR